MGHDFRTSEAPSNRFLLSSRIKSGRPTHAQLELAMLGLSGGSYEEKLIFLEEIMVVGGWPTPALPTMDTLGMGNANAFIRLPGTQITGLPWRSSLHGRFPPLAAASSAHIAIGKILSPAISTQNSPTTTVYTPYLC